VPQPPDAAARVDRASRLIRASPATVYGAFASAGALEQWLAPRGMTGRVLTFDFRAGGGYRMRLTYDDARHGPAKTSAHADEVEVRFVKLVPHRRIEQAATFDTQSAEFAGEMRMIWTFEPASEGSRVEVRCAAVPAGIRAEEHEAGLASTLENLAAYAEGRSAQT
jgi:uncharacterized protein YndB with AHSA1/START domain